MSPEQARPSNRLHAMSPEQARPSNRLHAMSPELRIVRGRPTPEELAALVVVLAAVSRPDAEPPRPQGGWAASAQRLRSATFGRSPGGWRASSLPR
jgi:hypothetical protein